MMRRRTLVVGIAATATAAMVAVGAGAGAATTSSAHRPGVQITRPAGYSAEDPSQEAMPAELPTTSLIADNNSVSDQLTFAKIASSLPLATNKSWKSLGPYGLDMPPGYQNSVERFARVSGMGASAVVDPRDTKGNTIIIGDMGGAWRSTDAGAHWTNLTDGKLPRSPVGALAIDKSRPNDLYVGTGIGYGTLSGDVQGTGIYVSHDNGKTFSRPSQNTLGYATNAIATTASGVLVGTTHGLYYSTDHGASFHEILLKSNTNHTAHYAGAYANWISAIAVNPQHANEITVAIGAAFGKRKLSDGTIVSEGNGLYRSTNGVKGPFTYMPSSAGLTNALASKDPIGRVSLAYGPSVGQSLALWALVSDAGLLNAEQPAGLDIIAQTTGKSLNVSNTLLNGLYRSGDDGKSWTLKADNRSLTTAPNSTVATLTALGYGAGVQAYYNNWVAPDPTQPDKVFFGLEEVYQTLSNAGPTPGVAVTDVIQRYADACGFLSAFQNYFQGISCPNGVPLYSGEATHPDQHVGVIARTPNGIRLYTGNDGGFFREDSHSGALGGFDNSTWTDMNTIANYEPYHAARKPDGEIILAMQDNGTGFFKPGGRAITESGGDGVLVIPTSNPDVWYSSSQGANFYVTKDHGHTNTEMQPNLKNPIFTSPIILDPTDENHLIAGAGDIQETRLGPNTRTTFDPVLGTIVSTDWTQTYDLGNSGVINGGNPVAWTTQALADRGATVYAAICGLCRNSIGDPKLIKTAIATNVKAGCTPAKSSSACWHIAKSIGFGHVAVQELVIDPQDLKTIYVVLNENSLVGLDRHVVGNDRVMVSHDAGDHFTDLTGNLPRSNERKIVMRDGQLIVAGDNGVFTAKAGTTKWSRLAGGLPQSRVFDITLDPTGRYLTAAVYGRGVWQLDFGTTAKHSSAGPGPTGEPYKPIARGPFALPLKPLLALLVLLALAGAGSFAAARVRRQPVLLRA